MENEKKFCGGIKMRVGLGYDVHKLVEGRDLIIGGVQIPYDSGNNVVALAAKAGYMPRSIIKYSQEE